MSVVDQWEAAAAGAPRVQTYLVSRGLLGTGADSLRLARCNFRGSNGADLGDFDCILARVQALDGETVALHRTYLDDGGAGKLTEIDGAAVESKKLTPTERRGATRGAAIRLFEAGEVLALSEGVETSLAVHEATGLPVWSTVSAGGLASVELPPEVRTVAIWADNDGSEAGQKSALAAAERLGAEGRVVYVLTPPDALRMADERSVDWLDVLTREGPQLLLNAWAARSRFISCSLGGGAIQKREPASRSCGGWEPVPMSQLRGSGRDETPWVWEGYVARDSVTLLVSPPKAGKTTLLSHLLAVLGGNGPSAFAGARVEPCKVLVVSEEPERIWEGRRDQLGLGDNVHVISRPFTRGRPSPSQWEVFLEEVAGHIDASSYGLVMFDTLPNLWGVGDENAAVEVDEALRPLHSLNAAGAAVLLVHHSGKGETPAGQAARGSSALNGFADMIVEMRSEAPAGTRRVLRYFGRYDIAPPEVVLDFDGREYSVVGTTADARMADRRVIEDQLIPPCAPGVTADEIHRRWPREAKVPRPSQKSIRRDLDVGHREGSLRRDGGGRRGDPFRYYLAAPQDSFPDSPSPIGVETDWPRSGRHDFDSDEFVT